MPRQTAYRFHIGDDVPLDEAEMSLQLATIVLEGLFSPAVVRLDARYHVNAETRSIVVDASTPVGQSLVRVFTTLLAREFGDGCFAVRRVAGAAGAPSPDALVTGAEVAQ
jgi:hypothetical protein